MQYDPSYIEVLSGPEHIRNRPGMYLGGTDRVAAAFLIAGAADVLLGLTVDHFGERRKGPVFEYHAFLDVSLTGRRATLHLEYSSQECPDFDLRCRYLAENRDNQVSFRYAMPRNTSAASVVPLPVVSALSTGMVLATPSGVILHDPDPVEISFGSSSKDSQIAIGFDFRDILELEKMSQDFLEGFVHGNCYVPGLVVRSVTYRA